VFETLKAEPPEGLIATMAAFAADTHPEKLDLGVGVYRDAAGQTPVMAAVRAAETAMLARQSTKAYVGAGGNRPFAAFMEELVLGAGHPARAAGRVQVLQTPGGCGALRLAADLVLRAARGTRVLVSDPTWPNHMPLLGGAGLAVDSYPYYDAANGTIAFEAMLETLDRLPAGSLVVLHGSCHNPTGADLSRERWRELAALLGRRGLVPLVDLAYQGLGEGPDADAWAVRLLAESLPEVLIGASCSKSFGLYRERVGAVIVVAASAAAAQVCMGQLQMLARRMYSFPPDHGAAVVATVAGDPALRAQWAAELEAMRTRIAAQRERLAAALRREFGGGRYDFIAGQRGMFSLLGLDATAVARLRAEHHIYIAGDSRVNIAGLPEPQVERLARAIHAVAG
jgi:aromatic-amino-acid transaminase